MEAPGSGSGGVGEHSRAYKVRSAQLALEASVCSLCLWGYTPQNYFDYLSIILALMDLKHSI